MRIVNSIGRIATLSTIFLSAASHAKDADPVILAPSSKWIVQVQPDRCNVIREFGADTDNVLLQLSTNGPDAGFSLTLIGEPAKLGGKKAHKAGSAPVEVAFLPGGPSGSGTANIAQSVKEPALFMERVQAKSSRDKGMIELNASDEDYSHVDHIDFSKGLARPITLQTGTMLPVLKALDQCEWQLVKSWGLDAEANRDRSSPPKLKPGRAQPIAEQVQEEYSAATDNAPIQAFYTLRLIVDANGVVTGCKALSVSADDELAKVPCQAYQVQDALFDPALDADDNPISSWVFQSLSYFTP